MLKFLNFFGLTTVKHHKDVISKFAEFAAELTLELIEIKNPELFKTKDCKCEDKPKPKKKRAKKEKTDTDA